MITFNWHRHRCPSTGSIGFRWCIGVFLCVLLVPVASSMGRDVDELRGQESETHLEEKNHVSIQILKGPRSHYAIDSRRDPFLPLIHPQSRKQKVPSINQAVTQKSSWLLLGIVSGMEGYYASIQAPEGKRYIVTVGSVIPGEGVIVNSISKTELKLDVLDKRTVTFKAKQSQTVTLGF